MKNFRLYAAALAVATMPVLLLAGGGAAQAAPPKCTATNTGSGGWAQCTAPYSGGYYVVINCKRPGLTLFSTYERWGNQANTADPSTSFLRGSWAQCDRGDKATSVRAQLWGNTPPPPPMPVVA